MGDVGSVFLGFLIGISAIISHFVFGVSCVFWLIIYSAFCFDATITLIRRFISGEKWYLPHRSHAYQRLQNIGWKHKDILYALFLLNVFLLSVGLIAYYYDMLFIAVELVFILLSIIYLFIELSEKKYEKSL
jgi:Fuc2NAc and GlcNAc transferase